MVRFEKLTACRWLRTTGGRAQPTRLFCRYLQSVTWLYSTQAVIGMRQARFLGVCISVDADAQAYADKNGVKIFTADIIYHLETHFTKHLDDIMELRRDEARNVAVFPATFKISPRHVFNAKDPIIVGGQVTDGILKVGTPLCIPHLGFLDVGVVRPWDRCG